MLHHALPGVPTRRTDFVAGSLAFLGTALLAFDDIAPLRALGGGLLASPGFVFLLIAIALIHNKGGKRHEKRLVMVSLGLLALVVLTSIVTLPFLPDHLLGESTILKAFKITITLTVWCTIFTGAGSLVDVLRPWLLAGLLAAIAIMLGSAVIGQIGYSSIEGMGFIHGTRNSQMRLRGTRFEASSLGAGLITCFAAIMMVLRGRKSLMISGVGLLVIQLLTRSRGTWVTTAIVLGVIAALFLFAQRAQALRDNAQRVLSVFVVITVSGLSMGLSYLVTSEAWVSLGLVDGSGMTSEASRSVWAMTSLISLGNFPIGMGFAGYLTWLPDTLAQGVAISSGSFTPADFYEMSAIIRSGDDMLLSPKTLPGILIVFFGWAGALASVGLAYVVARSSLTLSKLGYLAAPAGALALLLVSFTYSSSIFSWEQALVFGWFVSRRPGSILRMDRSSTTQPRLNKAPVEKFIYEEDGSLGN